MVRRLRAGEDALGWRGPTEYLIQERGDAPIHPVVVRPAVRPDEEVVGVLANVEEQQVRCSLRIEPIAQRCLLPKDLEDDPVAIGPPGLGFAMTLARSGSSLARAARLSGITLGMIEPTPVTRWRTASAIPEASVIARYHGCS